jgi:hypothetical protein
MLGLACAQAACSLGSLDYLKNGAKQDSGVVDHQELSDPDTSSSSDVLLDTAKPDGPILDATAGEVPLGADGSRLDDAPPVVTILDAQQESSDGMSTDALIPDTRNPDSAGPDAKGPDSAVPDALDNLDVPKLDRPIADSFVPGPDSFVPDSPPDLPNPDGPAAKPSVLLVVGATNPLSAGDTAIQSHLVGKGYDVTLIRDNASTTVTQTLVVISRSISSGNVGTKYRNVAKPVMVNEYNLFDSDMGLVSATAGSTGGNPGADSLDVQAAAGELAAGLSGPVKVFQTAQDVTYGVPNAQAILVAALTGQTTKWGCFAYETGTQMNGLVAPARRVGFFSRRRRRPAYRPTAGCSSTPRWLG